MTKLWSLLLVLPLALGLPACGGDSKDDDTNGGPSGDEVTEYLSSVEYEGGPARFRSGSPPEPQGDVEVVAPTSRSAINGGSTTVTLEASAPVTNAYVSVDGVDGYAEVEVTGADITLVDLVLTFPQELPENVFDILFQVEDADGNVSEAASMQTAVTEVGTGELQVSVAWDVDNDLDLYVIDPNGFQIYYAAEESPEGGTLDLDSNAACIIDSINNENIRWLEGTAPEGTYTVMVDNFSNCTGDAANWVVTVQKLDAEPETFTGTFAADDPSNTTVTVTEFEFP